MPRRTCGDFKRSCVVVLAQHALVSGKALAVRFSRYDFEQVWRKRQCRNLSNRDRGICPSLKGSFHSAAGIVRLVGSLAEPLRRGASETSLRL